MTPVIKPAGSQFAVWKGRCRFIIVGFLIPNSLLVAPFLHLNYIPWPVKKPPPQMFANFQENELIKYNNWNRATTMEMEVVMEKYRSYEQLITQGIRCLGPTHQRIASFSRSEKPANHYLSFLRLVYARNATASRCQETRSKQRPRAGAEPKRVCRGASYTWLHKHRQDVRPRGALDR
jgi:hypothetical protein